jgi:hypothetical protein
VNLPANGDATILSSFGSNSAFGWYLRQDEVTTGDWRIFRRQVNVDYQVLNLSRGSGAATFASSVAATTGVFSISAGNPLQAYQTSATNSTTATIRQTGAGGNGNNDIGLVVDIQAAADTDRIVNFRYFDGTSNISRFLVQRNGFVGIVTDGYSVSNTLSLGRVFGFVQDINSGYIQANMANSGNYIVSQYAVRMHLDSALGEITFLNAPSGTAGNAVSLTSVLKITASGNVGIGTTSPSQKLEVVGGEIKAGRVDSTNEGGQVSFARASDNATAWYIDSYGNSSSTELRFVNVSTAAVAMTIAGSNLQVNGQLSADRHFTARGNVSSTSGNWVNLYQLPTNYNYVLLIHVRQPETFYTYTTIAYVYNYYNGANNYPFVESYVKNGNTSLQISGGYIQARQSSGSNASMYWDITIFGSLSTNF